MAPPVDTSVKFFTHEQVSAPSLTGQAGSLIAVLDACLVDGFGMQTATSVVVAGGVATVTFPNPFTALVHQVVLVAGATPSELNGEQKVIAIDTTTKTIQFATEVADGTASGTITVKMAPAGWTKAFSGTNKAAYKINDVLAHSGGMYLRIDDTAGRAARVRGFETMTDVDTGTGPFPTDAQISGGGYWSKSDASTSATRRWAIVADSRFFFFYRIHVSSGQNGFTHGFGDYIAKNPAGDAFATGLNYAASETSNVARASFDVFPNYDSQTAMARPPVGLGGSYTGLMRSYARPWLTISSSAPSGTYSNVLNMGDFPNPFSGELYLSRMYQTNREVYAHAPRADVPGIFDLLQTVRRALIGDLFGTIEGTGEAVGKHLLILFNSPVDAPNTNDSPTGASVIDITGPWR